MADSTIGNQDLDDQQLNAGAFDRYNDDSGSSAIAIRSMDDIRRISNIFIGSGMFKGDKSLSQAQQMYQAGVKIIAGVEFGIQPFAAMRGINIINGNAEMSANLMAAKVKKHPKYDYKVTKLNNDGCTIIFYEIPYPGAKRAEWEEIGESSFTHEDAVAAQLAGGQNWRKFARNMYFARAMSNGVRFYTPDVFYGAPVYVEGEISGEFAEESPASAPVEAKSEPAPVTDDKPEPQEAEVVESHDEEEESLEWLHEEIAETAKRKGYNELWIINAVDRATDIKTAKAVIDTLNALGDKGADNA